MIGDNIRYYRTINRLSQEALAQMLGVPCQSIYLWENNQVQPSIDNLVGLASIFRISTDTLLSSSNNHKNVVPSHAIASHFYASESIPTAQLYYSNTNNQNVRPKAKRPTFLLPLCVTLALLLAVACVFFTQGLLKFYAEDALAPEVSPLSAAEVFSLISPSVVEITAESRTDLSTGTGFFYDKNGTVITNYHVIENCQEATITLANGSTYKVTSVLGYNADRDIAILSTTCKSSKPLSIRATAVETGETVYALGSSLGLTGSLSNGIVSATNREVDRNVYIQTTTPISPGNSGGPLVDAAGSVVGIICASFTDGQNLNLAIPISALATISLKNPTSLRKLFPEEKREVEWLSDYRFFYYEEDASYVLLFQLSDKEEIPVSASGTASIRIVNDYGVSVYENNHSFSHKDFEEWIYDDTDEVYAASIYIPPSSIEKGYTQFGLVYFVIDGEEFSFDEVSTEAFDLPLSDYSATAPNTEGSWNNTQDTPSTTVTEPYEPLPPQDTCLVLDCENTVNQNGEYCSIHGCATSGCPYSKSSGANYCSLCCCFMTGCTNPRSGTTYYCTQHACIVAGCTNYKDSGSDYCFLHTP